MKKALLLVSEKEAVEFKAVLTKQGNNEPSRVNIVKIIRKKKVVLSGEVDNRK